MHKIPRESVYKALFNGVFVQNSEIILPEQKTVKTPRFSRLRENPKKFGFRTITSMARFNLFQKRNKNAVHEPVNIRDYVSSTDTYSGKEATSFAAVDIIANTVSSLGFGVYDRTTRQAVKDHWLYELIAQPNLDEVHSLFFNLIIRDYFDGNIFLYLYKNADGKVISLFRLDPRATTVKRDELNRKQFINNGRVYYSDRVLHIPSKFGYNGLKGRSIFEELRTIFDTSMNLDAFTSNTFNQNLGKRLVIDTTDAFQSMSDDQAKILEAKLVQTYCGVANAGKPIVKRNGLKFETLDTGTSSNQAAQLSENRMYQTKLIAELFHIPPEFLIGGLPGDIESLYTVFANQCIEPLATEIAEYFNLLLSPEERSRYYFEFSYNSLMKTSLTKRVDSYAKQLTNGILSVDEIRKKENLAELGTEAANTLLVPANLMPVKDDVFNAYMASAKQKAEALTDKDTTGVGDDKK